MSSSVGGLSFLTSFERLGSASLVGESRFSSSFGVAGFCCGSKKTTSLWSSGLSGAGMFSFFLYWGVVFLEKNLE